MFEYYLYQRVVQSWIINFKNIKIKKKTIPSIREEKRIHSMSSQTFKHRDRDGSTALEDEGESAGKWSFLEDDKDAGCFLKEQGASDGYSLKL